MALNFSSNMLKVAVDYIVNKDAPEDLILRLYKNNYTPVDSSLTFNFTESDFVGYEEVELDPATWDTETPADPMIAVYSEAVRFASSAGGQNQNVYGYYIVRAVGGDLVLAERFPAGPYEIRNNGDFVDVTPRITAGNLS